MRNDTIQFNKFMLLLFAILTCTSSEGSKSKLSARLDSLISLADSLDRASGRLVTEINKQDPFVIATEKSALFEYAIGKPRREITLVSKGDSAYLYEDSDSEYFHVEFGGKHGYLKKGSVVKRSEQIIDSLHEEYSKNQKLYHDANAKITAIEEEIERKRINAKYGKKYAQIILAKKLKIGMSREMVIDSWGEPEAKNKSIGSWGTHEQWVYESNYLYFENGTLKSYQSSE